jgi:hypothetical protein
MKNALFALLLAGSLMVPQVTAALGDGAPSTASEANPLQQKWWSPRSPVVPETVVPPGVAKNPGAAGQKVDILWNPKRNTGGPLFA